MKIFVKAPAKINLSLDVLHKRPDGYHELEMIMTTVDLADRIELAMNDQGEIAIKSQAQYVPSDERNLAYRAAHLLKTRFQVKHGVDIYIDKQIPVSAGLGGGSSDAAAVLRGLNQLWDLQLSQDELAEIGLEIGSDVPFCVYGGTALVRGRGERITPLPAPPNCWVVLAKPPIGVSTREIYEKLNLAEISHPDTGGMVDALLNHDYNAICERMENVLESVTFKLYPEVERMKKHMESFQPDGLVMSGTGPTLYALVKHDSKMQRLYNGLRGYCDQVYRVRMLGKPIE